MTDIIGGLWHLHWLAARGSLQAHQHAFVRECQRAFDVLSGQMSPPPLDILFHRSTTQVIAQLGLCGRAWEPALFSLYVDPDNPNLAVSLDNGAFTRQLLHEIHHCMRMAGPGYGYTLGEALVSEGLAGQFVSYLLGTPPELWEAALPVASLGRWLPDQTQLEATGYNHAEWFFGTGRYPLWLGYTLGYELAGQWLGRTERPPMEARINAPAKDVLRDAGFPSCGQSVI
ncbi:DUF2268 domain-containing putative Zn-dependent protease [Sodalis sp. C49]|uniref:DUF2268 domain-containing putative Zn-dependent protease n=1 Tax=unclassified Sodalis (in: enterobacteria) TaxID=2636512 RepID=UPI003965CF8B